MNREMLVALLRLAERHVVQGERHVAEQRMRIRRLDAAGHDSAPARELFSSFEALQATYTADRDRLSKALAALL